MDGLRRILDGLIVVELSRYIAGPYCGQLFGDLGAIVIKVESLGGEPGRRIEPYYEGISLQFYSFNRNKHSIALNLRSDEGKGILAGLLAKADVFVCNYRPGVLNAMGFSAENRRTINPSLVDVNITGFGPVGRYSDRAAYDEVLQAESGLMSLTGFEDGPPTMVGAPIIDVVTGLYAFAAAVAGLHSRSQSGEGTQADINMYDSAMSLVNWPYSHYLTTGNIDTRKGNRNRYYAGINTFKATDGYVQIIAHSDQEWRAVALEIGGQELADDERFRTVERRQQAVSSVERIIGDWVGILPAEEVVTRLMNVGVLATHVRSIPDVAMDPETTESGRLLNIRSPNGSDIPIPTGPIRFRGRDKPTVSPPVVGQSTNEILETVLGASASQIATWSGDGVIGGTTAS